MGLSRSFHEAFLHWEMPYVGLETYVLVLQLLTKALLRLYSAGGKQDHHAFCSSARMIDPELHRKRTSLASLPNSGREGRTEWKRMMVN